MLTTRAVETDVDLRRILALQRANRRGARSDAEERADGFVTVEHSFEMLRALHAVAPSIVAVDGTELAGYALVMPVESAPVVPILAPLFERLRGLSHRGRSLAATPHYVMGQVCVDARHRGRGVVDAMYREHRARLAGRYALVVTEIATRNTRSLHVHERVGFTTLEIYRDALEEWAIVGWDWCDPGESGVGSGLARNVTRG
jgi:ribosomal protein S18 acetylase RimI-like enzyme